MALWLCEPSYKLKDKVRRTWANKFTQSATHLKGAMHFSKKKYTLLYLIPLFCLQNGGMPQRSEGQGGGTSEFKVLLRNIRN